MTRTNLAALGAIFSQLDSAAQQNVLRFAEFLLEKQQVDEIDSAVNSFSLPLSIEPVAGESVVAALRRLTHSYNMLDSRALLARAVDIMNGFVLQGRDRVIVIRELETLFQREYEAAKQRYETSVAT